MPFNDTVAEVVEADPDFEVVGFECFNEINLRAYRENRTGIGLNVRGRMIGVSFLPVASQAPLDERWSQQPTQFLAYLEWPSYS